MFSLQGNAWSGGAPDTPRTTSRRQDRTADRSEPMSDPTRTRRRGGRPPKSEAERRDSFIGFWVTADEHARILARASASGVSAVSSFARAAALDAPVRSASRPANYSPEIVAQLRRIGNNLNQCLYEARVGNFRPSLAAATEDAIKEVSAALRAQLHGPEH